MIAKTNRVSVGAGVSEWIGLHVQPDTEQRPISATIFSDFTAQPCQSIEGQNGLLASSQNGR